MTRKIAGVEPMSSKPRKEQILDSAEKAFAKRGPFGVSLRDIARDAEVDVSLVSYHFGKREDVFDAVIMRRLDGLNTERRQYLDEARRRAAPGLPSLEDVIDAFSHTGFMNRTAVCSSFICKKRMSKAALCATRMVSSANC